MKVRIIDINHYPVWEGESLPPHETFLINLWTILRLPYIISIDATESKEAASNYLVIYCPTCMAWKRQDVPFGISHYDNCNRPEPALMDADEFAKIFPEQFETKTDE